MLALKIGKFVLKLVRLLVRLHWWLGGKRARGTVAVVLAEILAVALIAQAQPSTTWAEYHQELIPEIRAAVPVAESRHDNINAYLKDTPLAGRGSLFVDLGDRYKIDPDLLVAITGAESSFGQNLTTQNNFGNVGNTDSGRRQGFETPEQGLEAIPRALNNRYLGPKRTIESLSGSGKGPIYASSAWNWERNVLRIMSELKGKPVTKTYEFRR